VSSTPGKTKHCQTLPLDKETMLCDCPGLVFPSFVATSADMVCAGVLPINQLRDHMAPVDLVCRRVPGPLLRSYYGLKGEGTTTLEPSLKATCNSTTTATTTAAAAAALCPTFQHHKRVLGRKDKTTPHPIRQNQGIFLT